jgi:hypothetical protein
MSKDLWNICKWVGIFLFALLLEKGLLFIGLSEHQILLLLLVSLLIGMDKLDLILDLDKEEKDDSNA